QGTGLVVYLKFARIPGHGDPDHAVPLTRTEARRAVALLEKSEKWSEIARKERVGLFSKRIGFVDDELAAPQRVMEVQTQSGTTQPDTRQPGGSIGATDGDGSTAKKAEPGGNAQAGSGIETARAAPPGGTEEPKDFIAVNFNSYEDGSTSAQIEHAIAGFSRRFNLTIDNALKLAKSTEATLDYATYRLEKRDLDFKEKSKLFQ
ncbi:MAG: hypothetical protein D6773_11500, partial [Alphaproteobacteria bacterium]